MGIHPTIHFWKFFVRFRVTGALEPILDVTGMIHEQCFVIY